MTIPWMSTGMDWTSALLAGISGFAARATLLLLAAWCATSLMRHRTAAARHLVWSGAVVATLLLPVFGVLLPEWKVRVIPPASTATRVSQDVPPAVTAAPTAVEQSVPATVSPFAPGPVPPMPAAETERTLVERVAGAFDPRVAIAVAWLLLTALLLVRLAVANARLSSWYRSSRPVEDARLLALVRHLCRRFGIQRPVVLLESEASDVPVTWGVIYPVILLPRPALDWDEEQLNAVLTHELAHVKRFDALTQLCGQMTMAVLWFHPLAWVAVRRMRMEREHACDDFVLAAGARATRYADDLLGLARRLKRSTAPAAAALAMARRSELEGRLLAILDPSTPRGAIRRARVAILAASVLALAAPLAAFRAAPRVAAPLSASTATSKSTSASTLASTTSAARRAETTVTSTDSSREVERAVSHELLRARADTDPVPIDLETLLEVTNAAKRITSDVEKGQLLELIARRYQRSDALRDAYLDAVFTMTSDTERAKALLALLDRDSLPISAVAKVLRTTAMMTSDVSKGTVLKHINADVYADTAVQRAYLDAIVAMTSDMERGTAIATLLKQRPLTPTMQLSLLDAITPMTSDVEKANALLLFLERQGIANDRVRRAFFTAAGTLTSDADYRRVMTAVMK